VCTYNGSLAANSNLSRITIVGDIAVATLNDADADGNPHTGSISNAVTVAGTSSDWDASDNADTEPTPTRRSSDLAISARWAFPVVAGGTSQYLIDVANLGPSPATGAVIVTDPLPAGVRLTSVRGTGWTCAASTIGRGFTADPDANGDVSCTRTVNEFASGATLDPITVTVQFDPALVGGVAMVSQVEHANDRNPTNNSTAVNGASTAVAEVTITADSGESSG
jgi:uncharacterized repeat protein (TIGR01451 family)